MRQGASHCTATDVAALRALHQLFDDPKVFDDPLALHMTDQTPASLISYARRTDARGGRCFRAYINVRSRFVEDELANAVASGVTQCVILGAGFDTLAYRNRYGSSLAIFEVDLPATQRTKQMRLKEKRIPLPPNVTFVPIDLERTTLGEAMAATCFKPQHPAFFSWIGVTPYLTSASVTGTLEFVAALVPGSGAVFDFFVPLDLLDDDERKIYQTLADQVAVLDQPYRFFIEPQCLMEQLRAMGFRRIQCLDSSDINARYFRDRSDGFAVQGNLIRLMSAYL